MLIRPPEQGQQRVQKNQGLDAGRLNEIHEDQESRDAATAEPSAKENVPSPLDQQHAHGPPQREKRRVHPPPEGRRGDQVNHEKRYNHGQAARHRKRARAFLRAPHGQRPPKHAQDRVYKPRVRAGTGEQVEYDEQRRDQQKASDSKAQRLLFARKVRVHRPPKHA